mgnify:CR=1 FL=1
MAQLVSVPPSRVSKESLQGLLEEFASRDGTDYGVRETPLDERVRQLRARLDAGEVELLFDLDSETWDLLPRDDAKRALAGEGL